ncbi:MAG: hypothetical protein Q8942_03400 [Bacillota bacterium]|nr:hypothetical protein [Bacillota bacterium]
MAFKAHKTLGLVAPVYHIHFRVTYGAVFAGLFFESVNDAQFSSRWISLYDLFIFFSNQADNKR